MRENVKQKPLSNFLSAYLPSEVSKGCFLSVLYFIIQITSPLEYPLQPSWVLTYAGGGGILTSSARLSCKDKEAVYYVLDSFVCLNFYSKWPR